ncbi:TIR domain-containing protein [Aurantimonas sp. C2-6-R+9]|uniref:TIR domain-containing protein n=1 Tax=unclassified Aurantimonas TaxID=2638230 RepID=UPI002E19AA09|nr:MULTISPECIES: TIR domain-containing protein [unclassified Aurantimonas]MEC5293589.1 TIR domain-containing protein [Aurantimonas sp. C2-3-R2]MEC5383653.1 TIR domain-containing protein [Aurantimonas sp. C2-6-R+9]MEC5414661.1 TIR domain-containing protein [Aurantimonas sp. C2-4-R8]
MAKKCFLSFHYKPDCWRVSQVKKIGAIEEQPLLDSNDWESIKKKGDGAIEKWIADNMKDKDCLVVLVGEKTAGRRWVKHEIKKAWKDGLGVLAIHIHNMKNPTGEQAEKGSNPFTGLIIDGEAVTGKVYDPPYKVSTNVYDHIKENISTWIDDAIKARG